MHEISWERTLLDQMHSQLETVVDLESDELPIISFFVSEVDWTLYTTHRLVGQHDGFYSEVSQAEFGKTDFGDFKGDLDSPRIEPASVRSNQGDRTFLYETGFASMAPIHYFKFWSLKWPVWRETYLIEKRQAEQDTAGQSATVE